MTRIALINARVLTPGGLRDGLNVVIEGSLIRSVGDCIPDGIAVRDLSGQTLVPGFIDLQVNGGGGALFNDDPSVETIARIARAHRGFGTTGLLPTLVSDDIAIVERGLRAVDLAIAQGIPGVLGIHVEGPFLAESRKGIHRADKLRPLGDMHVDLLASARAGRTLVTLAPECATPEQIARLSQAGVLVSLGHSNADYATARAALDAGATGFTHLFNAMSQLVNREPGMVGAALESEAAYAGIIVDGQHLHPATVRTAMRALGPRRLMLVSDAMPTVGSDIDSFELQGRRIFRRGDKLCDVDGTIAGSTLTMLAAVSNLMEQAGTPLDQAIAMASRVPASFLGLDAELGSITPGMKANLVALGRDFEVRSTWIDGEEDTVPQFA